MKSKIYKVCTVISAIIFIFFLVLRCTVHHFSSTDVKNDIAFLSSEQFNGRLCGTNENEQVANYIAEEFKELDLKPIDKEYTQGFQVVAPFKNDEVPTLEIKKDDNTVKKFNYGTDFKEDMLNFKVSDVTLSSEDNLNIFPSSISFKKGGDLFLLYVSKEDNFKFRSSFVHESPVSFAIAITKDTYNEIVTAIKNNSEISISLPYTLKTTEVYNVAGKIEGKDSNIPPLILTAHFDHMGADCLDNIYAGALDNASGASFLLEFARYLSTLPKPNRDIIFVGLNGEEFGLIGSNKFASKYKDTLKGAKVINFDMIGAPDYPITFMRGEKSLDVKSDLLDNLESICKELGLESNIKYEDASDHASFINNGFDSLTISHSDVSRIHTPYDKIEFISEDAIKSAYDLCNKYIIDNNYNPILKILFNDIVHAASFIIFLMFIGYPILKRIDKHKRAK
ncbi:M28 family metallopeptidase [Clostridium sardiniense]